MNALTTIDFRQFVSAYRQIRPVERVFVDAVVADMEAQATKSNMRISMMLHQPVAIADEHGHLAKPMVRAAIAERVNDLAAATELTVQRVIKELMAIAFSNIRDYQHINEDGELTLDFTRCTPEQMSAIKSLRIKEPPDSIHMGSKARECTIQLWEKPPALTQLIEIMSIMDPNNPHWHNGGTTTPTLTTQTTAAEAADAYAALLT